MKTMKNQKGYIILCGTVDGPTCEDSGFLDCANFALADTKVYKDLDEAKQARQQIVEKDRVELAEQYEGDAPYSFNIKEYDGHSGEISEVCLDVEYDDGLPSGGVRALFNTDKVVNRTTYKIQEVDC